MTRIGIIGAGLSGRLLTLNLLRQASSGDRILLIDRGDARYMGPAYSNDVDDMLLNVPAGIMGALPDQPGHFLDWAKGRGLTADEGSFLPRSLYREYVLELIDSAERERVRGVDFAHLRGEVTDVEVTGAQATIHLEGGETHMVDRAVLALGNFPPPDPSIENPAALESSRYVHNPWDPSTFAALSPSDTVLFIGTGQTTVDIALAIERRGHTGRMVAVSRRGLLPLAHPREPQTYPSFADELDSPTTMRAMFRTVLHHVRRAQARSIDPRAVIDSLRPHTPAMWQSLPPDEKRRFMRHAFRYWERIRSRIPPQSADRIEAMRASGRLHVDAGRILDLADTGTSIEVRYAPRDRPGEEKVSAAMVINCMGPDQDYTRIDHPLVRNLRRRGLIRPGLANLGMDVLDDGAILDRDGVPSSALYTLGSTMKGLLWEVLAVPEIRVQARDLAALLLRN